MRIVSSKTLDVGYGDWTGFIILNTPFRQTVMNFPKHIPNSESISH